MNMMQKILNGQEWIAELRSNHMAVMALNMAHDKLPKHIKKEISDAAKSSGVNHQDLIACNFAYEVAMLAASEANLSLDMLKPFKGVKAKPAGCTTCVVSTTSKNDSLSHIFFGRNLDWGDSNGALKESFFTNDIRSQYGESFTSITFPGFSGVLTGHSPNNFAVALNAMLTDDPPCLMAAAPTFLIREALDTCATFDDAVQLLSETPLMTSAVFTVVDVSCSATARSPVVIERAPLRYARRRSEELSKGVWGLVATNEALKLDSAKLDGLSETSCNRYRNAISMAAANKPIDEIMVASEFGITIYTATGDFMANLQKNICFDVR